MKYEAVGDWIFGKPLDIFEQNGVLVINEENRFYLYEVISVGPTVENINIGDKVLTLYSPDVVLPDLTAVFTKRIVAAFVH